LLDVPLRRYYPWHLWSASSEAVFRKEKAAAVLKHGILSRYIVPFAAKTGSTSKDSRVVVPDGYAGEARYEDRSPGSPIYMIESARKVPGARKVELIFVEKYKEPTQNTARPAVSETAATRTCAPAP
jgi:three-Cys-motif partner protein